MQYESRYIKILISLVIAIIGFSLWYYWRHPLTTRVKIGNHIFTVELAVTPPEKARGLSGRQNLAADHGMLFVYDHKESYEFWMHGMKFPLDFIWIEGQKVVDITTNVPPLHAGEPLLFVKPRVAVDKVLEVAAGTVVRLGIQIGDSVEFLR